MNTIYFDCCSGISGDMALGALLDAGLELAALRAELAKLSLPGWQIDAEAGQRGALAGVRARVHAPEVPNHRHLADVRTIIGAAGLHPTVANNSLKVFTLLAEAEARVHGVHPEQVHFHEVGALDAIIDIVGVVAGLHLLGVEAMYASPLPLGHGWVRAAHGLLPLPAPATLYLLAAANAPTLPDERTTELVTPTGAALLAALARFERPALRLERVGHGLGMRDTEKPNLLRVWLGRSEARNQQTSRPADQQTSRVEDQEIGSTTAPLPDRQPLTTSTQVLLETNIDDQSPAQLAYVVEQLLALGALDAWQTPIVMKKGRAATLLAALVPAEHEAAALTLLMHETTTLGVRRRVIERYVCERRIEVVQTPLGPLRRKRKYWSGTDLGAAPEYEDCARLARQYGVALRTVYQMAADTDQPKHKEEPA